MKWEVSTNSRDRRDKPFLQAPPPPRGLPPPAPVADEYEEEEEEEDAPPPLPSGRSPAAVSHARRSITEQDGCPLTGNLVFG
jgi:hypothetical protein